MQWVCSYITHKKQCVQTKGTKSSLKSIPFCKDNGPTLFNLYLNDICNISSILKFTLFADYTNIT